MDEARTGPDGGTLYPPGGRVAALTNGRILFHEIKKDILYRVAGTDLDGQRLQVEVALYEETITIKIVTAF